MYAREVTIKIHAKDTPESSAIQYVFIAFREDRVKRRKKNATKPLSSCSLLNENP